ncbi:hypothetical protein KZZ52_26860 [Dactylosporangium sp. AC04546]|nr:hypothetical protein [Dactylosporangium sp. AC04546]WVK88888.1 hypothetical protein KZZ52_26860 [Dactylosporangium sp. AC04546]
MPADDLTEQLRRLDAAAASAEPGLERLRRLERDLLDEAAAPDL